MLALPLVIVTVIVDALPFSLAYIVFIDNCFTVVPLSVFALTIVVLPLVTVTVGVPVVCWKTKPVMHESAGSDHV